MKQSTKFKLLKNSMVPVNVLITLICVVPMITTVVFALIWDAYNEWDERRLDRLSKKYLPQHSLVPDDNMLEM